MVCAASTLDLDNGMLPYVPPQFPIVMAPGIAKLQRYAPVLLKEGSGEV